MADTVWSQCRTANWWKSFDNKGWSKCGASTEYLTGFYRNNKRDNDPIFLLEEGKCCKAPVPNQNRASTCNNANWWTVLDRLVTLWIDLDWNKTELPEKMLNSCWTMVAHSLLLWLEEKLAHHKEWHYMFMQGSAGWCSKNRVLCFRASLVKLGYYGQTFSSTGGIMLKLCWTKLTLTSTPPLIGLYLYLYLVFHF